MEIGIIGSGNIGGALARHFAKLGRDVKIANSRGPETLRDLASEIGATAVTAEEAAGARDLVVISIPQKAVPDLPIDVLKASTAVIVDTGNYYPARDGRITEIDGGMMESEWVERAIGRPVVKAFNHIYAASLADKGVPAGSPGRISLSIAGDDPAAKKVVLDLINEIGFDGVDAGTIAESWRQQPGTPAYGNEFDVEGRKAALAQADRGKIEEYRNEANEAARAWFV
ncbi:MAG: NAD(P)-binding domain-containing protein [Acidobacteriota bacterium]